MDASSVSTAASLAAMRAQATQQALAATFVRQNADQEAAVVALLEKAATPPPAPEGQGRLVDVTA